MAMPRKSVNIATGKIGKQKRLNKKQQEEKLKLERDEIEAAPPSWLVPEAAAEYKRVVRQAGNIGILDNLDLTCLAVYAAAYVQFTEAHRNMMVDGFVTVNSKGVEVPSPWVGVADKAAAQIMKCSSKLGLYTTDRLRLIVPEKETQKSPVEKWLQFLPSADRRTAVNDA